MIVLLETEKDAKEILRLQILSYQVEADIMKFTGIPRLYDTVEDIQSCPETFYGYFFDNRLVGCISFVKQEHVLEICRMVVHPDHFKKGIATALLRFVLQMDRDVTTYVVHTGTANVPATSLYKKFGFVQKEMIMITEQVSLTKFVKEVNLTKEE
ncbi:GNAT family N-acetyltransferase [Ectobacillus polymachus]|uniref:GNAT family N-acetyltransferase n=1 Tax=Ectobacillus polymachus TaxID=1508806 RepID=UPI003A89A305